MRALAPENFAGSFHAVFDSLLEGAGSGPEVLWLPPAGSEVSWWLRRQLLAPAAFSLHQPSLFPPPVLMFSTFFRLKGPAYRIRNFYTVVSWVTADAVNNADTHLLCVPSVGGSRIVGKHSAVHLQGRGRWKPYMWAKHPSGDDFERGHLGAIIILRRQWEACVHGHTSGILNCQEQSQTPSDGAGFGGIWAGTADVLKPSLFLL